MRLTVGHPVTAVTVVVVEFAAGPVVDNPLHAQAHG
jgi:hypothetical protein